MLTAGSVIDAARNYSVAFDPKAHPNRVCLRFLSMYVRQLHGKIVAIDPDAVRVEFSTPLPLVDFAAGIALPVTTRYVWGASAVFPAPSTFPPFPIDVIQSDERNAANTARGVAWQVGNALYLSATATAWKDFATVVVSVVLAPDPLAALEDILAVPDLAEQACVEAVAGFLAGRADVKVALSNAEGAYLADVMNNVAGRTFYTQDVR